LSYSRNWQENTGRIDPAQCHSELEPRTDLRLVLNGELGGPGLWLQTMRLLMLRWFGLLTAAALLAGCSKSTANGSAPAAQPAIDPIFGHLTHAQPKLQTLKLWVGAEELVTEIARTDLQIRTGMMYRTNMLENEAMIFVFPFPRQQSFYMRNCTVPLSAAYIRPDGVIDEIVDLEPGNETGVDSRSSNLQFVLEVPQGWFARHNIQTGAMIRTEKGSLQETFFRR